jgi:hypothetical protein
MTSVIGGGRPQEAVVTPTAVASQSQNRPSLLSRVWGDLGPPRGDCGLRALLAGGRDDDDRLRALDEHSGDAAGGT